MVSVVKITRDISFKSENQEFPEFKICNNATAGFHELSTCTTVSLKKKCLFAVDLSFSLN